MSGYITYSVEDLSEVIYKASTLHATIESLLQDAGLFNAKYAYNVPTSSTYIKLEEGLKKVVSLKTKYDVPSISDLNNELTKFTIAFANSIKMGPAPLSVSISVTLMEYILFLYIHL